MRRALHHARRGLGCTTPNPIVGACVVTDEGVVVGDGTHERAGEPHAEIHALDHAGERARGATLYCTLEPCVHTGRTGPCTERIVASGIRRVVAAIEDPDPRVSGRGFAALHAAGLDVTVGVCDREAARLNQPFFTAVREQRPFVILKAATSLDGRIGERGRRTLLTSAAANKRAHATRAWVDAIAVGSETLMIDDPLLTARDVFRSRPLVRVVFDRRLRTSPSARVLSTISEGPVLILTAPRAIAERPEAARSLERAGATLVPAPDEGLAPMLRQLLSFDIQSVLIEGGAGVHAAAWDAGIVDYVQVYITPHVLGGGVPFLDARDFTFSALIESRIDVRGPDVIIEGYVHRPH